MLANCVSTVEKHRVEKKFWRGWAPAEYSNQTTSDLWTIDIDPSDQRGVTVKPVVEKSVILLRIKTSRAFPRIWLVWRLLK